MENPVGKRNFDDELSFTFSRSSGPGGQSVNKTNSKVTLHFNIETSALLIEEEKLRLKKKLKNRISKDATLIISSESSRSQLENREEAIQKFYQLISAALKKKKKRKATKPTKASKEKRLNKKKQQSEKKKFRQKLL